jgi:hypothetical protein
MSRKRPAARIVSRAPSRASSAMPWLCPACDTPIRHHEPHPRPRVLYRCHICRLELVVHAETGALMLAPLKQ